jgi:glycerophosphoryl diester phosphodiesterase
MKSHDFSIGHRGASLHFPEHTKEGYVAAADMGAGIIECDVTFTKDQELVCRHSQVLAFSFTLPCFTVCHPLLRSPPCIVLLDGEPT